MNDMEDEDGGTVRRSRNKAPGLPAKERSLRQRDEYVNRTHALVENILTGLAAAWGEYDTQTLVHRDANGEELPAIVIPQDIKFANLGRLRKFAEAASAYFSNEGPLADAERRLAVIEEAAQGGIITLGFDLDGGVHATVDEMGGTRMAVRNKESIQEALDALARGEGIYADDVPGSGLVGFGDHDMDILARMHHMMGNALQTLGSLAVTDPEKLKHWTEQYDHFRALYRRLYAAKPTAKGENLGTKICLRDVLRNVQATLKAENENAEGAIRDTIWLDDSTTLFDYIEMALAPEPMDAVAAIAPPPEAPRQQVGGRLWQLIDEYAQALKNGDAAQHQHAAQEALAQHIDSIGHGIEKPQKNEIDFKNLTASASVTNAKEGLIEVIVDIPPSRSFTDLSGKRYVRQELPKDQAIYLWDGETPAPQLPDGATPVQPGSELFTMGKDLTVVERAQKVIDAMQTTGGLLDEASREGRDAVFIASLGVVPDGASGVTTGRWAGKEPQVANTPKPAGGYAAQALPLNATVIADLEKAASRLNTCEMPQTVLGTQIANLQGQAVSAMAVAIRKLKAWQEATETPKAGGSSYEASLLRNLLAVIHKDGGQFTDMHGIDIACKSAEQKVMGTRHQKQMLVDTLGKIIMASGMLRKSIDGLTGPQLVQFGEEFAQSLGRTSRRNTPTHEHLSTMIGLLQDWRKGRLPAWTENSPIAEAIQAAVDHMKDWPYSDSAESFIEEALQEAEAGLEVAVGRLKLDGKDRGDFRTSEELALEIVQDALKLVTGPKEQQEHRVYTLANALKFHDHSMLLNGVLWKMAADLGVMPDTDAMMVSVNIRELTEKYFSKWAERSPETEPAIALPLVTPEEFKADVDKLTGEVQTVELLGVTEANATVDILGKLAAVPWAFIEHAASREPKTYFDESGGGCDGKHTDCGFCNHSLDRYGKAYDTGTDRHDPLCFAEFSRKLIAAHPAPEG